MIGDRRASRAVASDVMRRVSRCAMDLEAPEDPLERRLASIGQRMRIDEEGQGEKKRSVEANQSEPRDFRKAMSDTVLAEMTAKEHAYQAQTQFMTLRDFKIDRVLGKGGFGVVQLGILIGTKETFAIKLIDLSQNLSTKAANDLQNEVAVLRKVKGKFLVDAYSSFVDNGKLVIIMEYLSGGDFRTLLDEEGRFEEDFAQFYLAELVLGLEELHTSIVHRDLKPENLLLGGDGHLKLSDFGLSELHGKISGSSRSGELEARGTIDYMAPETLTQSKTHTSQPPKSNHSISSNESDSPVNDFVGDSFFSLSPRHSEESRAFFAKKSLEALDWWAFGCLVYEFLVGISPFAASSEKEVRESITRGEIEWPMDGETHLLSAASRDLIERLLDQKPLKRLGVRNIQEVKTHPFFQSIDWSNLRSKDPPFKPAPLEVKRPEAKECQAPNEQSMFDSFQSRFSKLTMSRADLLHQRNQRRVSQIRDEIKFLLQSPRTK